MNQGSINNFFNKNKETSSNSQRSSNNENTESKKSKFDERNNKKSITLDDDNYRLSGKESKLENTKQLVNDHVNTISVEKISVNKVATDSILLSTIVSVLTEIEKCKGEKSKEAIKDNFSKLFIDIILNYPNDLIRCLYFLLTKIGSEYRTPDLGIGGETVIKCVAKAVGKTDKYLKLQTNEIGDLALVAAKCKETQGTMDAFVGIKISDKKPLTIKKVMNDLISLSLIKGKSSFTEKERILVKLMFDANPNELKFIVRFLQGSLNIGAAYKTMISALSRAVSKIYLMMLNKDKIYEWWTTLPEKDIERIFLLSINQVCDYDLIIENVIKCINEKLDFKDLLNLCPITPGIPVKPMLAKPTTGLDIIVKRFDGVQFTCEYKYDGFRGQIHYIKNKDNVKIQIFSRNNENMTETYPDLIECFKTISNNEHINDFILDCEVVAFDNVTNKILPFQVLTTRARKNVQIHEITQEICIFIFDIIYLNSKSLVEKTLDERRKIIANNFIESKYIKFAKYIDSEDLTKVQDFMSESISDGMLFINLRLRGFNSKSPLQKFILSTRTTKL